MTPREKIERIIIAVLALALVAGLSCSAYLRSRPLAIRLEKFDPDVLRQPPQPSPASRPSAAVRVNINSASAEELAALSGVGKTLAGRIVAYRDENGLFISAGDIRKVKGIGDALYEKIKDSIVTE